MATEREGAIKKVCQEEKHISYNNFLSDYNFFNQLYIYLYIIIIYIKFILTELIA